MLSNFEGLLEVQSMTRIFKHNDIVIGDVRKRSIVESGVIQDLPLERVSTVQHQTFTIKSLFYFWESINLFLIVVDGLQIDLQRAV